MSVSGKQAMTMADPPNPRAKRELAFPRGVSARDFKHERRLQIAFTFHGVQCRELMPPGTITQTALTHASGLRAEILRKIELGTFKYADYFPESDRAKQFDRGGYSMLVGKLLEAQLEVYRAQVKNKTMSPSTLAGYEKAITGK